MSIKEYFLSMGNFILQDGRQIRFWEDSWLGTTPLKIQYPNLYNIACRGKIPRCQEMLITTCKHENDWIPLAANDWGTTHPVSNKAPCFRVGEGDRLPRKLITIS
jgi:hypothetical protein